MTEAEELAEMMHKAICTSNHIDMCDWEYSEWYYPRGERERYLTKATKMLDIAKFDTVKAILELI